VDQDNVRSPRIDARKSFGNGILPFLSARNDGRDLLMRASQSLPLFFIRQDKDDLVNARMRPKRFQAPFQDGLSLKRGELLGRPEAPTTSGSGDDRRHFAHFSSL
jgi:hypothetical protein